MGNAPSPALIFDTMNAYQRSAALKGAIDLGIFTAIAEGHATAGAIAAHRGASERGVRILCDYLVTCGLLAKHEHHYANTPDTALFLDRKSPAYMGSAVDFLNAPTMTGYFDDVVGIVKKGGTVMSDQGSTAHDHPIWERFARAMGGLAMPQAMSVAAMICGDTPRPMKVLDIAAGHGVFGIAVAQKNPQANVVGLDWDSVLEVARDNARRMGVSHRYTTIAGDAFTVDLGGPYDAVLLPNILHHFDAAACENLLARVHGALKPGGQVVIVEFVVAEDRVSPPAAGAFALIMLATTPSGDVYTFKEYEAMLTRSGFKNAILREVGHGIQMAVVATA
jgi:ubiquinone/menaquinone biosynthesis C-methylase UbiE